jgi:hypothetical protein
VSKIRARLARISSARLIFESCDTVAAPIVLVRARLVARSEYFRKRVAIGKHRAIKLAAM